MKYLVQNALWRISNSLIQAQLLEYLFYVFIILSVLKETLQYFKRGGFNLQDIFRIIYHIPNLHFLYSVKIQGETQDFDLIQRKYDIVVVEIVVLTIT